MTEHRAHQLAPLRRRAAAQVADAMIMASILFVAALAVGYISAIATQPGTRSGLGDWGLREFLVLWVLLLVPASIPTACYEIVSTARRGGSFGKRAMEVRVTEWNGHPVPFRHAVCASCISSFVRWAIPHLVAAAAAIVAGVASAKTAQGRARFPHHCRGCGAWGVDVGVRVLVVRQEPPRMARQGRGHRGGARHRRRP